MSNNEETGCDMRESERKREKLFEHTDAHAEWHSCGIMKRPERSKKIDTFRFGGSLTEGAGLTVKR